MLRSMKDLRSFDRLFHDIAQIIEMFSWCFLMFLVNEIRFQSMENALTESQVGKHFFILK